MSDNGSADARKENGISVHRSVEWLAEKVDKPEEIMDWFYSKRPSMDRFAAETLMERFPLITDDIFEDRTEDVRIIKDGLLVLATPPRVYTQWKYDFLKSDILVFGPEREWAAIANAFDKEKAVSREYREKAQSYVDHITPCLDLLFEENLISGALCRGSYFCKNGFPAKEDDVDFMLLSETSDKEEGRIMEILKRIPRFAITFNRNREDVIREGESPRLSFGIVTKGRVIHGKGIRYERYVLKNGVGIALEHLTKEGSERLAREWMALLPDHDNRAGIPRLPSA